MLGKVVLKTIAPPRIYLSVVRVIDNGFMREQVTFQ